MKNKKFDTLYLNTNPVYKYAFGEISTIHHDFDNFKTMMKKIVSIGVNSLDRFYCND